MRLGRAGVALCIGIIGGVCVFATLRAVGPPVAVTALGPVNLWVGLTNSDDVGIKFDLKAQIFRNTTALLGSGELASVPGGSSGFNNANQQTIAMTPVSGAMLADGDALSVKLYVRNACVGSGKNSGRMRLWYDDAAANSRAAVNAGGLVTYYLHNLFALNATSGGGPKRTIDTQAGAKCSPYAVVGTWSGTATVTAPTDTTAPVVTIGQPANGAFTNATNVTVSGSVTEASAVTVAVNGVAATVSGTAPNRTYSATIPAGAGPSLAIQAVATDAFNNTGQAGVTITIDRTAPTITAAISPAPNAAGWNNTNATVTFTCGGTGSPVASCPSPVTLDVEGANQSASGTATDAAGNSASTSVSVNIDKTAPALAITSPQPNASVSTSPITASGTLTDALSGVASAACGATPATVAAGTFSCSVALAPGPQSITVSATDPAGNTASAGVNVTFTHTPTVTITSPANLTYTNITPTTVNGTVDEPTATVTINSITAAVVNGAFSLALPLAEGPNIITATALSATGTIGTSSIEVNLDTTPPHVTVTSPADQFVTLDSTISIAGNVNDIVVGTVNDQQAQVTVNGVDAQVANRNFIAQNVALNPGPNVIQVIARDRVGNAATTQIAVTRQPTTEPRITTVSGNHQIGTVGAVLAAPLIVALLDGTGGPAVGKPVIFKVRQNDGTVAGDTPAAATAIATTDANGHASAIWTLGNRSGAGANVVEAYAVGYEGTALFDATSTPGDAAKIVIDTGNAQVGAVGQSLPRPLIAVVVDAGNNRLAGVPVDFGVLQGGGNFGGQPTFSTVSDSDGRVAATLTLGPQSGHSNNLIAVNYPGNTGSPAVFTASGLTPGNPADTSLTGVVLDNSDVPIQGVIVRAVLTNEMHSNAQAVQTAIAAQTDAQGQFTIEGAPVGLLKVLVDGSTAQRPGVYPSLEYDIVTVAGQRNTVGTPIYLLPLNPDNQVCVTETSGGGTLSMFDAPGFSLTFAPGQVTFPGGSKSGCISVTAVHGDKVPMTPSFGQQPRFVVTIQPPGAHFNPPAPITLPNVDGLRPREVTELYSFDHDIGTFVSIGTGVVSDDGLLVQSSPGVGVLKAGWHGGGPPNPTGNAASCPTCQKCVGSSCVSDEAQDLQPCSTASVPSGVCLSGTCVPRPITIFAEVINQDNPQHATFRPTDGPVYGGTKPTTADDLKLIAKINPQFTVTSYEWTMTGPSLYAPPGSSPTWVINDLEAAPGTLHFTVTATLNTGQTISAERDIEVGVRTNDVVVVGWINPDGVTLPQDGVLPDVTLILPPEGLANSFNIVLKTAAMAYLGQLSLLGAVGGLPVRPIPPAADTGIPNVLSPRERQYVLNWMFKYAGNFCAVGKCPPQDSFGSSNAIKEFQIFKRTSYKLFNRLQIKYLVEDGQFKGTPQVVQRAVDVGITNNPVFNFIEEGGASGQFNGVYGIAGNNTAYLMNDGTPTSLAVAAFNALTQPNRWSNIGSRIEMGVSNGATGNVFRQVYPTYFVFDNLQKIQVFPQATEPSGNFNLTPYPPNLTAPFIRQQ